MNPTKPPKGLQERNEFWQDHRMRIGINGDCECTCDEPDDNYQCLFEDAEYYADCTEWDMPGWGSLIRSSRTIVKSFESGSVKKHQDKEANRFR